jgi:hypothetical protein
VKEEAEVPHEEEEVDYGLTGLAPEGEESTE